MHNTSKFLIISLTGIDTGFTSEFYTLIHVHKNPAQLIAKDLLYEMVPKVVSQHKNTDWAIDFQFGLYLHMYVFYWWTF